MEELLDEAQRSYPEQPAGPDDRWWLPGAPRRHRAHARRRRAAEDADPGRGQGGASGQAVAARPGVTARRQPRAADAGGVTRRRAGAISRNASSSTSYQRRNRPSGAMPSRAADRQRGLVARPDDGVDLRQPGVEAAVDHRPGGLGGVAVPPRVRVQVPADLDLADAVRQRLEQHRAGRPAPSGSSIAQQPNRSSRSCTAAQRATSSSGGTDGGPPSQRVTSSRP